MTFPSQRDVEEQRRRSRVASELDRREFWKSVYLAYTGDQCTPTEITTRADSALAAFDERFMKEIK